MKQALRIFRKDLRRHWPEIVISIILLALYCWRTVRTQHMGMGAYAYGVMGLMPWLEFVQILLPLSWFLFLVRLVHDETLVGDRQWWITKPYEWPSLLAAKLLSIFLWLLVPLFFAKCFLLRSAGFAITPHLGGLLRNGFGLPLALCAFCFVLACVTRTSGHTVVAVIAVFLLITGLSAFSDLAPDAGLSSLQDLTNTLSSIIIFAAGLVAVLWQFARRKTAHTRAVLLSAIVVTTLIDVVTPYRALMEKKYPVIAETQQPARLALGPQTPPNQDKKNPRQREVKEVLLQLPVEISGIPAGNFVTLDAQLLVVEDSRGGKSEERWQPIRKEWWPEDHADWLNLTVQNSVYQKLKSEPVKFHLEIAVTEYRLSDPRQMLVREGEFPVPSLGICGTRLPLQNMLICRVPFEVPPFVATFDPSTAKCPADKERTPGTPLLHFVSFRQTAEFIDPATSYQISFFIRPGSDPLTNPPKPQNVCVGDFLAISTPVINRRVRTEALLGPLQMEKFRVFEPERGGALTVGLSAM